MSGINIGAISEALNDKTDRDLRNVDMTAKADAIIDYQEPTSANSYTWYRKYKSGWVEQGGYIEGSANPTVVTLPLAMGNTNYFCGLTPAVESTQSSPRVYILKSECTTTTISLHFNSYTAQKGYWEVKGMGV